MSNKRKHGGAAAPFTSSARSSSFRDDDDLQPRRAFHVSGAPDFSQAEPQTAEEYLRRVRWEAQRQPKVLTSTIDPRLLVEHRGAAPSAPGYGRALQLLPATSPLAMPSKEWENAFASQFADVRLALLRYTERLPEVKKRETQPPPSTARMPPPRDYPAWTRYCLGADFDVERYVGESQHPVSRGVGEDSAACRAPELHTVAAWDQLATRAIFHRLVDHLDGCYQRASAGGSTAAPSSAAEQEDDAD